MKLPLCVHIIIFVQAVHACTCGHVADHLHTCRYILDLTKDQKAQFVAKSTEMASSARLKVGVHLLHGTSCWFNNSHCPLTMHFLYS